MTASPITYLLWNDLVGVTRTRGVPSDSLDKRLEAGLGWACAGQALTPFEDIVDNPWGPMDEARQVPDPATRFTIPGDETTPPIDAVICDSRMGPDEDWDCCTRTFLRKALDDLHAQTGLSLNACFEHEFLIEGEGFAAATPFSFAAARQAHGLLADIQAALIAAGIGVEAIEPEYGTGQYEISTAPRAGLKAADDALVAREVIREIVRRRGLRATFTPKPGPEMVGNGAHVHISLADSDGTNTIYEPNSTFGLSETARHFSAGILRHVDALVAFTAAAPVSYYRLGPHHWSCGFRAMGVQNREAAIRVIHGTARDPAAIAAGTNLEYRPIDAVASPYLALGVLVRAGLDGIARGKEPPKPATMDPAEMSAAAAKRAGVVPLPSSLGDALDALEKNRTVRSWFSKPMLETYIALKRWEIAAAEDPAADMFQRYRDAY